METQLVAEFVSKTRASPNDALSCLRTWGWDLKKALIDYNGKLHQYISRNSKLGTRFISSTIYDKFIHLSVGNESQDGKLFAEEVQMLLLNGTHSKLSVQYGCTLPNRTPFVNLQLHKTQLFISF